MKQLPIIATLLTLAISLPGQPAAAQDAALQQGEFQGVPYLSGGVSLEEREQLFFTAADYNLRLLFAEKGGSYLSDTEVVVTTRDGRKVLELIAQGPFVFARLPAGEYRVAATNAGKQQVRDLQLSTKGQRQAAFYW
ncbi:carboxypeptidase regulatory-like domain-containing protein [Aromatoleum toluclasticum]|uniref:carboxypeptidase regulatory-like domain-containing protein n=1 Tax=Aromatoleum toluclasticum TaxID=92003 RepID=UPI001D1807A7|nr:carboxypeptidase regulatory-like domain-containing protein [Aromatoleum toluclasticum]MCC4117785.1 carboxypeptidase regulatory-like domain-containing protein [Aromatoleum toluclasticum]